LIYTPLTIGPAMLAAMRLRDGSGDIGTVFIGFTRYGAIVGIAIITTVASTALTAPIAIIGFGMRSSSALGIVLGVLTVLVTMVALIYLTVRFWFGAMICVDPLAPRTGPIEALQASWRITSGHALSLFLTAMLVGLIVMLCVVFLFLPIIFYGAPMAACVAGALYVLLMHHAGLVPLSGYDACPRCGYSLEGIDAAVCPECGADVPRPT